MQRSTAAILATTAVVVCLVLGGLSAFFVAREIASAPADLAKKGGEALASITTAFADHNVEIRFASEGVEIAALGGKAEQGQTARVITRPQLHKRALSLAQRRIIIGAVESVFSDNLRKAAFDALVVRHEAGFLVIQLWGGARGGDAFGLSHNHHQQIIGMK